MTRLSSSEFDGNYRQHDCKYDEDDPVQTLKGAEFGVTHPLHFVDTLLEIEYQVRYVFLFQHAFVLGSFLATPGERQTAACPLAILAQCRQLLTQIAQPGTHSGQTNVIVCLKDVFWAASTRTDR
jgi:hypothetical protein